MIAVWPLTTYRELAWTYVRPLDATGAEFADILFDETVNQREWIRAAWLLLRQASGADMIVLPYFRKGAEINEAISPYPHRIGFDYDVAVYVSLRSEGGDWETYHRSLSKGYRKDHAKSRRRLAELGTVDFEIINAGDARIPALIGWMLSQKRIWAERTSKNSPWLYSDNFRHFLMQLLADGDATPTSLMMCLTLDRNPIAIQICTVGNAIVEALIAAFDAKYEKYSPGIHLSEYLVKWAMEHSLDCDFGAGAEQYKRFWSRNEVVETATYYMAMSWWGHAALRLREYRKRKSTRATTAEIRQPLSRQSE